MLPIHTILFPTDFSPASQHAFSLAAALARDYDARLIAVHVLEPPVIAYGEGVVPPNPVQHQQEMRGMLDELRAPDKVLIERRLVEGDAVPEILRMADEFACDLIVMGTHGRSGLTRLLMGSVAEQVLRGASCMVLTVKAAAQPALNRAAAPVMN